MRRRTRASWRWVDTRPGPTNKARITETHVITQMQINNASRDFPLVAQFIHYAFHFFTLNFCRFHHRAVVELLAGTPCGPSGRHSGLRPEAGRPPRKRARRNGAQRQRRGAGSRTDRGGSPTGVCRTRLFASTWPGRSMRWSAPGGRRPSTGPTAGTGGPGSRGRRTAYFNLAAWPFCKAPRPCQDISRARARLSAKFWARGC